MSVFIFEKKATLSIVFLLIGAFLLRLWSIQLDPFLNMWDEQFHALVAKNFSNNLLLPKLLPDIPLSNKVHDWSYDHIWLHKQPFFMWLMAFSIKLFGANEWAIRLPSVLLGTLSVLGIYRIGKNLINHKVGYLAALLISTSFISLSLNSGYQGTDHNDLIFSSLIIISFWFYSEYYVSKKIKWVFYTGFVVGLAILTKWLIALILFVPWFIIVLKNYKNLKEWKSFSLAILTCFITFMPWQIYCYLNYYTSYKHELDYNTRHFSEVIEGHRGSFLYHFEQLNILYFNIGFWLMLIIFFASIILVFIKVKSIEKRLIILLPIILIYLFFSFAATKMPLFTLSISGLVYLTIAFLILCVIDIISKYLKLNGRIKYTFTMLLILTTVFFNLRFSELKKDHGFMGEKGSNFWQLKEKEKQDMIKLKNSLPKDEKYIIFNSLSKSYPAFTFYTGFPTYDFFPNEKDIQWLQNHGYKIIILNSGSIPKELMENKNLQLYNFTY